MDRKRYQAREEKEYKQKEIPCDKFYTKEDLIEALKDAFIIYLAKCEAGEE